MADPWSAHPIVFSRAINRMKLEIDSCSNVLITGQKGDVVNFISTDLEGLRDLYSLIEKACGKPAEPYPTEFDKIAEGE